MTSSLTTSEPVITDHGYQKSGMKGICDRCCFDWKDHKFKSAASFAKTSEALSDELEDLK